MGSGPNFFCSEGVRIDAKGRLHFAILREESGGVAPKSFWTTAWARGSNRFTISGGRLDDNAVLGIFLWDGGIPELHFGEVDIEISRWGNLRRPNAQFARQPYGWAGNLVRFEFPKERADSSFAWRLILST